MICAQSYKFIPVCPPGIYDNVSLTTAAIDCKGYDYATIICYLGATDIAMAALKVTESDTIGSGYADITGLVVGTATNVDGVTSALPSADDDDKAVCFELDLRGRKRYLDVTATAGNGTTGTYATVFALLWRADERPVSGAARGFAELLRV